MIWDYVINSQPENSQLIISTTEIGDRQCTGKVIRLKEERGLLTDVEYNMISEELEEYGQLLLEVLKKNDNDGKIVQRH